MPTIDTASLSPIERQKLLKLEEGHFADLKAIDVSPAKLTRSLSAFANTDGGELYIGVDEFKPNGNRAWRGFSRIEEANGLLQTFEEFFPLGAECVHTFLQSPGDLGYVLKVEIRKSRDVKVASNNTVYIRRGAQNLPVKDEAGLARLRRNKGITSFETEPVNADAALITNSSQIIGFMLEVIPNSEPESWLQKQQLLIDNKPTVGGLILFSDEPQAVLAKRCGVKIYRYKTTDAEGTRDTLDFTPISIDGPAYIQIKSSVQRTTEIIESVRINTQEGLESINYPINALHEIITNAVLHRDYSISDDIHIVIFDNRVDVISPGSLPAHITPDNILTERFARNGTIVRLINKFPEPPNKDVGEGLNTTFHAMREMKLKAPEV